MNDILEWQIGVNLENFGSHVIMCVSRKDIIHKTKLHFISCLTTKEARITYKYTKIDISAKLATKMQCWWRNVMIQWTTDS